MRYTQLKAVKYVEQEGLYPLSATESDKLEDLYIMTVYQLRWLLTYYSENQNKFITVKFLTKDNDERTYTGRMNVIMRLKGK